MENKYFLRAHMMNEHGVLHMEDTNQLAARSEAENIRYVIHKDYKTCTVCVKIKFVFFIKA